ncbi:hypothetical protein [Streptomyces sp. NPDC059479]
MTQTADTSSPAVSSTGLVLLGRLFVFGSYAVVSYRTSARTT